MLVWGAPFQTSTEPPEVCAAFTAYSVGKFKGNSFKGTKQTIIQVRLAPDGAILSRTMTSSSGDNAWDQAVLSAIDATQSLPKDDDGKLPTLTPELKLKPK